MILFARRLYQPHPNKEHVYAVQHMVKAELGDVHVARVRFYADDKLEIAGELLKVSNNWRTTASSTSGAIRL